MVKLQNEEVELFTALTDLGLTQSSPLVIRRTDLAKALGRMWTAVRPKLARLVQAGRIHSVSRNGMLTIEVAPPSIN